MGTPAAILETMNGLIKESLGNAGMQRAMAQLGLTPQTMSLREFGAFATADRKRWVEMVAATGIPRE